MPTALQQMLKSLPLIIYIYISQNNSFTENFYVDLNQIPCKDAPSNILKVYTLHFAMLFSKVLDILSICSM